MTTYLEAANAGFVKLTNLWNQAKVFRSGSGGGNFWMCGNTLHVAIDHMVATNQKDTFGFAKDALQYFDEKITARGTDPLKWYTFAWDDDFGWWGIALAHAAANADILGYDANMRASLSTYAANCWIAMNSTWDPSVMKNTDPNVKISGGIWNSKSGDLLSGRNCVTNEVYWRLCFSMAILTGQTTKYLPADQDAYKWFLAGGEAGVLWSADNLINERFKGTEFFNSNWNWLGDQGLMLGCCLLNHTVSKNKDLVLYSAGLIVDAVKLHRVVPPQALVLHEDLSPHSQFYLDYAGGKGVFIRNLAVLNNYYRSNAGPVYDEWIAANAAAVWNNQSTDGRFQYYWNAEGNQNIDWQYPTDVANIVVHASGQSALTAAARFTPNQQIPNKVVAAASA